MELSLATKDAHTQSALKVASRQLLILIALAYGISYIVPACMDLASTTIQEERGSAALVLGSGLQRPVEWVCDSALPRLWEHPACRRVAPAD